VTEDAQEPDATDEETSPEDETSSRIDASAEEETADDAAEVEVDGDADAGADDDPPASDPLDGVTAGQESSLATRSDGEGDSGVPVGLIVAGLLLTAIAGATVLQRRRAGD
jgi:MYXO-CTERM domain-containing protein